MISKSQITVAVFTFICFLVWLVADLIRTPSSFTPTPALTKALTPLEATFDPNALDLANKTPTEILPVNKLR